MSAVSTPGDEKFSCTATPELATNGMADVDGAGSANGDGDDEGDGASLATAGWAALDGAASPSAPVKDKPRTTVATTARPTPLARLFTGRCPSPFGH
jgi:hypothetical protein